MNNPYLDILQPLSSEKSTRGNERGQYTFLVPKNATKLRVKEAVEKMYGAKILKINMIPIPKKMRQGRNRNLICKRMAYKKAIVFLQDKKSLDLNKFIKEN